MAKNVAFASPWEIAMSNIEKTIELHEFDGLHNLFNSLKY